MQIIYQMQVCLLPLCSGPPVLLQAMCLCKCTLELLILLDCANTPEFVKPSDQPVFTQFDLLPCSRCTSLMRPIEQRRLFLIQGMICSQHTLMFLTPRRNSALALLCNFANGSMLFCTRLTSHLKAGALNVSSVGLELRQATPQTQHWLLGNVSIVSVHLSSFLCTH
jgi:hypothetical protein